MKSPPKPSATMYLLLYIAAAIPMGYVLFAIRGAFSVLFLLSIPILVAAAFYPRYIYLLMLAIAVTGHGVYLLYNTSMGASISFVVSTIALGAAGELIHRIFSKQVKTQEALEESEERLRALLNSIPDIVYTLDHKGNITTLNGPSFEWLEYEAGDLIGKPFSSIVHPDDKDIVANASNEATKGCKEFIRGLQFRIIGKDGAVYWVEMNSCIGFDTSEHSLHEHGVLRDITRRKRIEESLTESRRALLTLMSNLPGAAYRCRNDEKWTLEFISEGCRDLTGYRPEELIGNRVHAYGELIHPDDRRLVWQEIQGALRENRPFQLTHRMITRDGIEKWVWVKGREIAARNETTILEGFIIDITEQKLADEETNRLNVELAQRNIQLLTLYETGRVLSSTLELSEIYRVLYQKFARQLLGASNFFVALFDETCQTITCDFAVIDGKEIVPNQLPPMPLGEGFNNETIQSRQSLVVDLKHVSSTPKVVHLQTSDTLKPLSAIYVPMLHGDKIIGVLNLESYERQAFDDADMTLLSTLAGQAAVAIENARLVESERRQLQLAQNLQAIGSLLTAQMGLNEVLERIFDWLADVIVYDSVSVQLMGRDGKLYLKAWRGFPNIEHVKEIAGKISYLPFERRWGQNTTVVIPDTAHDERWDRSLGSGRVRSWIGAPLWVKGRFIGVLNVDSDQPNTYNDEIAHTAEAFANQAAIAIENARLFTESEERNQRLALLNRITRTGAAIIDIDKLSQTLADTAVGIIGSDQCYITLWDAKDRKTIPFAASGSMRDRFRSLHWEPNKRTLTSVIVETGRPLAVRKDPNSSGTSSSPFPIEVPAATSVLGVPLHVEEQDLGALLIAFSEDRPLTGEEILWAEQAGELIALALSKALAYAELERRVAERTVELTSANERLLTLTRLKDEFVSNVSHELRTPIASIKLYLRLLTLRPDKKLTYLERLDRETNRLEHIIEDLLQLSRMDQGRTQLNLVPTDFNRLARQFVTDREPLARERGLKLFFKANAELPIAQADEMLFGQALSVLLTNALNYTPAGGRISISTRTRRFEGKQWVGLSVRDTGPGIHPEDASRLFQRFFRGKVGRESGMPGTGLGLAIAKQIVEWHHGRIEITSANRSGKGAVFTIWIPIDEPSVE
ncbi:MAG: GAF domain-containing protein [Anaerolineae bacterium]|nr:GAF domain-containing protein [Anaerolineae bacterium]